MALAPGITELLARARGDLRSGVPVVLFDDRAAILAVSAESLRPDTLRAMREIAEPVVAITAHRADTLKARAYDGDVARVRLPADCGVDWIRAVADPAKDLSTPLKGPFVSLRGGDAGLHRAAITLAKEARLLPAIVAVDVDAPETLAHAHDLTVIDAAAAQPVLGQGHLLDEVISARVPLRVSKAGRLHVYRPEDGGEEHYAVEIGKPDLTAPVLVRLHSACFTGDLLGSLKCDCGAQLDSALSMMGQTGAGILLYLNQEGRGIGLANKMRAYSLQDQGFDTVEANHRLGFEDDERDFRIGSAILKKLGVSKVRLLTNNPKKVALMNEQGIEVVERVPLRVGENEINRAYLKTKAQKSGHLL